MKNIFNISNIRSVLVFMLWIVAAIIALSVCFPVWMVTVTLPRGVWHTYRGTNQIEGGDWEMPWYLGGLLCNSVRRLDPTNKKECTGNSKPVFAGS